MPSVSKNISPLLLCFHCSVSASSTFSVSPTVHFQQNTSSRISLEMVSFLFFLKEEYHSYPTLDTNICLPICSEKCLSPAAVNPAMHISVLSTRWPTLPAVQLIGHGLEQDSIYTSGLHLNASCALTSSVTSDTLFNLSLPQFPYL